MSEKKLRKLITKRLKEGSEKSDLYKELKEENDDDILRKILATHPSFELSQKFRVSFWIVNIIWAIFILIELLGALDSIENFDVKYLISFAISIYITIQIWKFNGHFYLPGIIWLVWTIFNSFKELYSYEFSPDFEILNYLTIGYSIVMVIGIIFMWIIRKNVFNYYKWFQPELNSNNKLKFE